MRVFIAIDINEAVRKGLEELQQRLRKEVELKKGAVKWVRPELVHLTLKFLGEVKDEQITEVCEAVKAASGGHGSFELDFQTVGFFGGNSAKVVWVGVGQGAEELLQLQKDIERELARAGWPAEQRSFSGHLTVCRVRSKQAGLRLAELTEKYKDFSAGSTGVDSVNVYQSRLTPQGPVYTVLAGFKLQD